MFEINNNIAWYDHGYWIRKWLGWPTWLPLPANSDHGLTVYGRLDQHEAKSPSRIFFTWNIYRYKWIKHTSDKQVFLIPHPYLKALQEIQLPDPRKREGTIIFWPHTTGDDAIEDSYSGRYINEILKLEKQYSPISICLHYHDMKNSRLVNSLHAFKLISAGSPFERGFAENLLLLIAAHKYSSAPMVGSYIPLCELLGVPFWMHGTSPVYQVISRHEEMQISLHDPLAQWLDYYITSKFQEERVSTTTHPHQLVCNLLGIDSTVSRSHLRLLMAVELLRLLISTPLALNWMKYIYRQVIRK